MDRKPAWRMLARVVPEFVTIVVGVLFALQVEGWRTSYEDSRRESEQLVALRADFAANRERYAKAAEDEEGMLGTSETLLSVLADKRGIPPDSLGWLIRFGATSWYEVEPVTGAYDALIASGDIGLIRDVELRRELAEFFGDLEAAFEDHDNLMDLLFELQLHAAEHPSLFINVSYDLEPRRPPSDEATKAALAIQANATFHGLLLVKTGLEGNRLSRQKRGLERVDVILKLIDARILERGAR